MVFCIGFVRRETIFVIDCADDHFTIAGEGMYFTYALVADWVAACAVRAW